jgi:hypothetical protein
MSNALSRREILASGIAALLAGSQLDGQTAAHAHNMVVEEKKATGVYKPKLFNAHEYATVRRLSELIIPQDSVSPSALQAGAPEFIDLMCSLSEQLADTYTGGLGWLDREMERRYRAGFVDAKPAQQTEMLDLIAYKKNDSPELGPGIVFFDWIRRMVVDAFYTSPIGVKDVGYMGNKGMATFQVPAEAISYALKKSPFA